MDPCHLLMIYFQVTGNANEDQLIQAMRSYVDKPELLIKAFSHCKQLLSSDSDSQEQALMVSASMKSI